MERQNTGRRSIVPCVNLQMTCERTIAEVGMVMLAMGVSSAPISFMERKNRAHKPIYQVRVRRLNDLHVLSLNCRIYAITKRAQWDLMLRFVESRLKVVQPVGDGRMVNSHKIANTEEEMGIYDILKQLNAKGRR